ncbi:radical SAM protein [Sphingomonas sp. PvP018]|uniref:radical SAM protein n=1 Tax=Sphingomonas sp. PvP018 TaxID=2817852 RepID=UPI001AE5E802|nr:radical SAM protein [Sphingomonas sp. PvP018]MBP2512553.1 oxygen-independent coproporphyrinogen-3 oxidase [Sphingomonas sp. PvP018]
MWTYHPDLLATPVPRYTSYPTAAEFGDDVGPADMEEALGGMVPGTVVSLYLHIPYCRDICWYCGCNTGAANRAARLATYVERLEREIALVAQRVTGVRVGRIAFGGGSPNAIPPAAFLRLVESVRTAFDCTDAILSVEVDPRGFDRDWAGAIGRAGVSRVSLGVQTLDPQVQAAIGRVQPSEDIRRTTALLRDAGVGSINFDLMYGLPQQSEQSLRASIAESIAMVPDRLAVFGYAHVPHLVPRQRRIVADGLAGTAERFAQAALAHRMLVDAGYAPVGFDHFARPADALAQAAASGGLRRNFQGFTEDPAEILIGLGASAISDFPDRILQTEKNTGRYGMRIDAGALATGRGLRRSPEDRLRGRAIETILTRGTADLTALSDGADIRRRLTPFERYGLIAWERSVLRLSEDALPYARVIASSLDAYRHTASARFSHAV